MKALSIAYSSLSKERTMRCDPAFQRYQAGLVSLAREHYLLGDIFEICPVSSVKTEQIDGRFMYCQISDIDKYGNANPAILNFDEREAQNEDYYKKIEKGDIISVKENDILMSFLIPADFSNKGKFVRINDSLRSVYFTSAFLQLRPKVSPLVMYYALRSIFYNDIANISRVRKGYTGYATISADDLQNARLGRDTVDTLIGSTDTLTAEIRIIEDNLRIVETKLRTAQSIIDKVFAREFGFDYAKFEELKTHTRFSTGFSSFANNPDMRFSTKFHREAGAFIMEQLSSITNKKIKHYLAEPIVLGASVSPKDFDENGSTYYVSMATIKTLNIELDESQLLSDAYAKERSDKTVKPGDIIIARSGVAIGKTALVKEEFDGIFADFTMRVRLTGYNTTFAYYYFRSKFFQYLIEVYKKGLQNKNIFPIVVREFPMPDIPLALQQRIVDEIQGEIGKQDSIRAQAADLRGRIDAIIESALT
jgi:hypothetical protein